MVIGYRSLRTWSLTYIPTLQNRFNLFTINNGIGSLVTVYLKINGIRPKISLEAA